MSWFASPNSKALSTLSCHVIYLTKKNPTKSSRSILSCKGQFSNSLWKFISNLAKDWGSERVSEKVCLELLTAETKSKSRQRRRLRPCAEKDKAMEPIPKVPNYCHVKLKAFPKMFSSKFCFLLNLAQVQLPKVGSLSFRSEIAQSLCFMGQLTNAKLQRWVEN